MLSDPCAELNCNAPSTCEDGACLLPVEEEEPGGDQEPNTEPDNANDPNDPLPTPTDGDNDGESPEDSQNDDALC